jgi:phage terminase large subunit-like protein
MLQLSPAQMFASLPEDKQQALLGALDEATRASLAYEWRYWARPNQRLPQGDWVNWLVMAGRGFGKTRIGAETVRVWARDFTNVNLIGATADDARDIMIEGESGILAVCPTDERPRYIKSERKLEWPNGSVSLIFTADEPERLRGKQHMKAWADELGAWRYHEQAWDQLSFGLRLGSRPQALITTTPKPTKTVRMIRNDVKTHLTRGSSYENRENLAANFFAEIINRYEGTRLGRQEIYAELLDDVPGALWTFNIIRHMPMSQVPILGRTVVAIDPAISSQDNANETGIICMGQAIDLQSAYVLDDASGIYTPRQWATKAIAVAKQRQADCIVAEANQGGEMVKEVIQSVDSTIRVKLVHASKGKYVRAEPVAALYERDMVYHTAQFEVLEDQMVTYVPDLDRKESGSPDRMDALVWAATELFPALTIKPVKQEQRKVVRR